jgi:predicted ester cyclase
VSDVVRRLVEDVWNGARPAAAHELVAPECPGLDGTGPDAVLAWHADRRSSFSDLRYEIVSLVSTMDSNVDSTPGSSVDEVALRWRATGTQDGPFGPVPPTGTAVAYSGASFFRLRDGQVVDVWSVNELFQLLQQLGVRIEPPS